MRRALWVVLVAAVVYVLAGAPSANATQDGVESLRWENEQWTLSLAPGDVWEVKLIDPAPQEIICGTNYGKPCTGTVFTFESDAECVMVQVDWKSGFNSSDPTACRETPSWPPTTPPTSPAPTPDPEPTEETSPTPSPSSPPPTEESPSPTPGPTDAGTPTPSPPSSPTPSQGIGTPESPTSTASPGNPEPTQTAPAPTTQPREGLAVTGPGSGLPAAIAIICILAGIAFLTRPRKDHR